MHFYWSTTYKKASLEMTSSFPKGLKSMILFLRAFFSFCKFHFSNLLQTQFFKQSLILGSCKEECLHKINCISDTISRRSLVFCEPLTNRFLYTYVRRSYQELNYWTNKNEISLWATKKAKLIMLLLNSFDVCNH